MVCWVVALEVWVPETADRNRMLGPLVNLILSKWRGEKNTLEKFRNISSQVTGRFYLFQQSFSLFAFVQPEDPSLQSEVAPKDVVTSNFLECRLLWSELSGGVQPWSQRKRHYLGHNEVI